MQAKEFPRIPQDDHSRVVLGGLTLLGKVIATDPRASEKESKFGRMLYVLGTSPYEFDFLYFTIYSEMKDFIGELTQNYNKNIFARGKEYMLKLINQNIDRDLESHFNSFQLAMYQINERSKVDDRWEPLSTILWGVYCSLYNKRDSDRFLDKFESIFVRMQRANENASLN